MTSLRHRVLLAEIVAVSVCTLLLPLLAFMKVDGKINMEPLKANGVRFSQ